MTEFQTELKNFLDEESTADNIFCEIFDENTLPAGVQMGLADSYGGEGQGEEYWAVYKFEREGETLYVKFDGCYYSYEGSSYDSWFFVEPREVVVTQYFKID